MLTALTSIGSSVVPFVMDISYESVRRWFLKFGARISRNLSHMRPSPCDDWHLDEMVIVIRSRRHWFRPPG